MKQYSMRIALFHWLTLVLIAVAFYYGHELDETEQAVAKMALYPTHFILGFLVLGVTILRTFFLSQDGQPDPLPGSTDKANKVASGIKHLLYTLLILVPVSGIVLIYSSGVLSAMQANDPTKLPDLEKLLVHDIHGGIVTILLLVVAVHVLAALQHQFILKDNIIRRIMVKRIKD